MIPVLVKTELRKASENELKLNKKDPQGSKCPFQRLQTFVLVPTSHLGVSHCNSGSWF